MRIAVVSDLYPPKEIGGYEIGISWIAQELVRQQHDVKIFHCYRFSHYSAHGKKTYTHKSLSKDSRNIGMGFAGNPSRIFEKVRILMSFPMTLMKQYIAIRSISKNFDLVLFGNPLGIPFNFYDRLGKKLNSSGVPYIAFVSDHWVSNWPFADPLHFLTRVANNSILRSALREKNLKFTLVVLIAIILKKARLLPHSELFKFTPDKWVCCSRYIETLVRKRAQAPIRTEVLYWQIPFDIEIEKKQNCPNRGVCLTFAGQISEHKGIIILIEALKMLKDESHLHIYGDTMTPEAKKILEHKTDKLCIHEKVSPKQLSEILSSRNSIVVVPSQWEEPYSIVAVQALKSNSKLVITPTGGSIELSNWKTLVVITDGIDAESISKGIAAAIAMKPASIPPLQPSFSNFTKKIVNL